MYNKLARTAMTAGTTIHVNDACNTAPAPATHQLIIETKYPDKIWAMQAEARNSSMRVLLERAQSRAQQVVDTANKLKLQVIDLTSELADESDERAELTEENIAQRKTIAQLEAKVAQLEAMHTNDQKRISEQSEQMAMQQAQADAERTALNRCVEMAEDQAKQSDAIRQICADRADLATEICRTHAIRADRAETLLELVYERIKETEALAAKQDKPADGLEQPTDNRVDTELAVETVLHQDNQVDGPEQQTNMRENMLEQPAKGQDEAVKQDQPAD
ncbi:hypothetical protein IW148_003518, partial [Coemansia sp. RSA 1199]